MIRKGEIIGAGAGAVAEGVVFAIPANIRSDSGVFLHQAGESAGHAFNDPRGGLNGLGDVITGAGHVAQAGGVLAITPEIAIPAVLTIVALATRAYMARRSSAKS